MAKSKNTDNNLKVPNILGLELDIAGDILDDAKIKYKIEDKKIITFFRDKNCVAKTTPKVNKPIGKNEVLHIYPSKVKIGPTLILLLIIIGCIIYYANTKTIVPFLFGEPNITQDSDSWNKSSVVYVTDDADFNYSTIDHYKYCISKSKSSNTCDWKDTYTKSVEVSESGTWFVWFKGISEDNNESSLSNRLKVQIDSEAPNISSIDKTVTTRSIEVKVDAKDNLSGVNKYYYSIDNQEYIESNKSYTFTSLEENKTYNINVRVVDKVGNKVDAIFNVSTTSTNKTNTESTTTLNKVIPNISMIDIPYNITYQDKYNLPTSVTPSKYIDNTICYFNDKEITNTSTLPIGLNSIKCVTTVDTSSIISYKDINVKVENGKDEIYDNYIRYNINYPTNATHYMYRYQTDDVRLDDNKWMYYTGPLYIPKDKVNSIIYKYNLNGENIVTKENMFVDIRADKYILNDGEETTINIIAPNKEDEIFYSINNSEYQKYNQSFKVKGNTLIKAYIKRVYKEYNESTNTLVDKSIIKHDAIYIENIYPTIGDKTNTDVSISLDDIPNYIDNNKTYSIPSAYSYGIHGSNNLSCTVNGKKINNTSDLPIGTHDIICSITALDGETKVVSKTITINKNNYKYDLDNIPSIIKVKDDYQLDNTCNIKNTNTLEVGKTTITCGNISKDIEVVDKDILSIDNNNIPSVITVGSLYELPSHVKGNNIKFIKCIDENKNIIYNTSTLSIGKHTITSIVEDDKSKKIITTKIEVIKPSYTLDISQ
jgi:hypothetical protein